MFETINREIETDAMIKLKNGKSLYGVIIDFINDGSNFSFLKFVSNDRIHLYRATESQEFVLTLGSDDLTSVNISLK